MTQYNPNPNATSNLSGWTKGGSSTTLTSTSEGARWVGGSSGSGRYLKISVQTNLNTLIYWRVGGLSIRRNSGTARMDSITCKDGHYGASYSTSLLNYALGPSNFVRFGSLPITYSGVSQGDYMGGTDAKLDVYLYAEDNKPFDFHIKGVGMYGSNQTPTEPNLDSNDAGWTYSQVANTLAVSTAYTPGNEAVDTCTWNWGDGTSTTSVAASVGTASHTYAQPGVYTVTMTATGHYGNKNEWPGPTPAITDTYSTSKTITVPVGTFQAGFDYTVSYPDVLVDASPSITPSLSPVQTYAWNWGDGTTGSGLTASHTYAEPGSYNVTLTISNDDVQRSSSITKSVVVSAPELPIATPQIAMGLFLDDPAAVTGETDLQAEMVPIINADDIRWNWTRNEVPTMSFQAPTNWLDQAVPGLTLDQLKSDLVIRLNFGGGWVEPPQARFVVDTVRRDPLNPQQVVQVQCDGIAADDLAGIFFTPEIIGGSYTAADKANDYARSFSGAAPGAVLWDLLPVATTPGSGAPFLNFLNVDFSQTVDSKGQAWNTILEDFSVPPDASGLALLQMLIDTGSVDWYCQKNLLRVFNPRTSGVRAVGAGQPELLPGRDISAAPQSQVPIRSNCWGAVVVGGDRLPYTVSDAVVSNDSYQRAAYRGRRYVAVQASDVESEAAALAAAKPSLASIYRQKDGEMVRELRFYDDMPWMPYRDYHVGDYVLAPGPDGNLVVVSVESITLAQNAQDGMSGSLILGSAFAVNSLQKKVANLQGGAGIQVGSVSLGTKDTGWVDVTVNSGFEAQTNKPQVRRIGSVVYARGGVTATGLSASASHGSVMMIPDGFRPSDQTNIFSMGTSSGNAAGIAFVNTTGAVDIRTSATLSSYYFLSGHCWTVD